MKKKLKELPVFVTYRRPEEAPINKIFKSHFEDGKRMCGRPNISWKEAVDRDSIAFGISYGRVRVFFRRQLSEAMDHN